MNRGWIVRPSRPDDRPALLALVRANYGEIDIAQDAYFQWQYEENPAGPARIWVAEEAVSGTLIGQYPVIPIRFICNDAECHGGLTVNLLTDHRHRRRGIFTELQHCSTVALPTLGISFTYGFPNPRSYPQFVQEPGTRTLGVVPLRIKPQRPARIAVRRFGALAGTLLGIAATLSRPVLWPRTRTRQGTGVQVAAMDTVGPQFDEFWGRLKTRHRLLVVRDARFLQWRYFRCPTRRYTILAAIWDGCIVGYLAGRVAEVLGVRAGLVVDLFVEGDGRGRTAAQALLAAWEDVCVGERVDLLAALMLPQAPEARALRACGYWSVPTRLVPQPVRLAVREQPAGVTVPGLQDWFVTFGDYDVA